MNNFVIVILLLSLGDHHPAADDGIFVWPGIGIKSIAAVPVNTNRLVISIGDGFVAFLQHTTNFSKLIDCHVVRPSNGGNGDDSNQFTYDLKPYEQQLPVIYETEYHEFVQRWTTVGNICGVRVLNTSELSTGSWNLLSRDEMGLEENGTIIIENTAAFQNPEYTNVTSIFGTSHSICASSRSQYRFCRVRQLMPPRSNASNVDDFDTDVDGGDDDGDDDDPNLWISYSCSQGYSFLQIENTQWLCKILTWGKINEISHYVSVWVETAKPVADATINELETSIVLTCRTTDTLSGGCRAISPNKRKEFLIFEGLSNENYSTFDSIPSLGICSFEIQKPLKEEDIGFWKILHAEKSLGCIFNVNNSLDGKAAFGREGAPPPVIESNDENDPIKIEIMATDQLIIRCEAPYVLDVCFLLLPNFQLKFVSLYDFQRQRHIGLCEFRNLEKLPGRYVCGFNKYELTNAENNETIGDPAAAAAAASSLDESLFLDDYRQAYVNIHYDVHIYDKVYGDTDFERMAAGLGENITMLCRSAFSEKIEHCAFKSPRGQVYLFNDRLPMNGRIQYFGNGLIRGECGVTINRLQAMDFGEWKCNFKISYGETQNLSIELEERQRVATGLIIGLSVTGFLLAMIIGGLLAYLIYRFKNRQSERQQQQQHLISMSNLENDSNPKLD